MLRPRALSIQVPWGVSPSDASVRVRCDCGGHIFLLMTVLWITVSDDRQKQLSTVDGGSLSIINTVRHYLLQ